MYDQVKITSPIQVIVGIECEKNDRVSDGVHEKTDGVMDGDEESEESLSQSETLYFSPSSYDSTLYSTANDYNRIDPILCPDESLPSPSEQNNQSIVESVQETQVTSIPPCHLVCYAQFIKDTSNLTRGDLCDVTIRYSDHYIQLISPKKALNLSIPFNRICDLSLLHNESDTYLQVIVLLS